MKHVLHKIRHFIGLGKTECETCWPAQKAARKPAARKAKKKKR
ncbi:MAG: hypothetical protein WC792_05235 [Candidatus Micrarchaeia archaeon]